MDEEITVIFEKAIKIEIFGYEYYTKLKNLVSDNQGKGLMGFLANAEEEHKDSLIKKCEMFGMEPEITELGSLIADVLMDEGQEKIFKNLMEKNELSNLDAMEALKLGMKVEANSIKFYKDNANKSPEPEVVALFNELSAWEQEHLELLKENLRMLRDEGSWYGYVPILEG